LEVVEVVLVQTKKQAVKTTTEWNLFIGLVRSMAHDSNCKNLNVAGFPQIHYCRQRETIERLMSPPIQELLYVTACLLHYCDMDGACNVICR